MEKKPEKYEKIWSNVTSVTNVLLVQNNIRVSFDDIIVLEQRHSIFKKFYLNWHFHTLSIKM